jgi:hypothetical protein
MMEPFVNGRRISSGGTFFVKRVFPVIWFGFLGVFSLALLGALASGVPTTQPPVLFLLMPFAMGGFGWVLMRRLVFDLADEVYDEGDGLRVRFGHDEERIPLGNIVCVDSSVMTNPPRITLTLREPGRFGSKVVFSPPRSVFGSLRMAPNPVAVDLMQRVDAAQRSRDPRLGRSGQTESTAAPGK